MIVVLAVVDAARVIVAVLALVDAVFGTKDLDQAQCPTMVPTSEMTANTKMAARWAGTSDSKCFADQEDLLVEESLIEADSCEVLAEWHSDFPSGAADDSVPLVMQNN